MSIIEKALKKAGDRGLLEPQEPSSAESLSFDHFVIQDQPERESVAVVADPLVSSDGAMSSTVEEHVEPSSLVDDLIDTDAVEASADDVNQDVSVELVAEQVSSSLAYESVQSSAVEPVTDTSHTDDDWDDVNAVVDFANQIDAESIFESDSTLLALDELPNVDAMVYKPRIEPEAVAEDTLVSHSEIRNVVAQKIIESPSDAKPVFNNFVEIDWDALAKQGYLNNNDTKSQLSEEFRVIKRPLVNNIQASAINGIARANLILICSSLPGEGKTFVSINLALSIANERDRNVLLIDADVEKPSVSKRLGVKQSPGLIEYLEDENVQFSDILLKTDFPNLSLIPAGKRHKYSTELLSSQRMHMFAEEVSQRYPDRVVIFDSPPLLVATQAHALAEFVGQVVLVVAAEATPQSAVNESVSKLSNCDVVMTVLNKTQKDFDIYGYGYGYGTYGR